MCVCVRACVSIYVCACVRIGVFACKRGVGSESEMERVCGREYVCVCVRACVSIYVCECVRIGVFACISLCETCVKGREGAKGVTEEQPNVTVFFYLFLHNTQSVFKGDAQLHIHRPALYF